MSSNHGGYLYSGGGQNLKILGFFLDFLEA
jgi:hypothetical protein